MADEVFEWITPAGEIFRLDRGVDGVHVVTSITGRHMPPLRRTDEVAPLLPGQRFRSVLHDKREVTFGLAFTAIGDLQLRAALRNWLARFDPTRGDGRLRITGPAGDLRELTCRYHEGLGLTEGHGTRDVRGRAQTAVVTFVADDPYWADPAPTVVSWQTGTPRHFFPFPPLRLGSSQVFASATIDTQGDVATFPVWTITGPGSELVLRNVTTGETLAWSGALEFGEQLTIDTRPGGQSIYLSDSTSQFGLLTAWDFWAFVPGTNQIAIELTGATEDSRVEASWQARYLGA